MNRAELSVEFLAEVAERLRVLAHPQRLRLTDVLERLGRAPVHALCGRLALPQAIVSQHLVRMRRAGLVAAERRGREVWYRIADPHALTVLDCIRRRAKAGTGRKTQGEGKR